MGERANHPICDPQEVKAFFQAVNLLNEKWVLHIISVLMGGPIGFNELSRLAQKVNTTTLSQRLQLLENEGIITRTVHSTIPPKTSYELTAKGQAFRPALNAIREWALQHCNEDSTCIAPSLNATTKRKIKNARV